MTTRPRPSPFDLTFDELQNRVAGWGEPVFRAQQIWEWLYRRLADSFDAMTDLPRSLRERLAAEFQFARLAPRIDLLSKDGWTRKVLFVLPDGKEIETVLMGYHTRRTACVSTQAGCAIGCPFCATGQGGLQRNLTAGEIVEQVLFFERQLRRDEGGRMKDEEHAGPPTTGPQDYATTRLTNIVFMGMGEPFANYHATLAALRRLGDPAGWGFGARRMTVSTVGIVPGIEKFTRDGGQVNLAVSIHAATDDLRDRLVPINKRYPLRELMAACRSYVEATRRRLSFEWALIDGVNDTIEQAQALARLAQQMPKHLVHVNLIPLNPTRGYAGAASRRERIAAFRAELDRRGIPNTLRVRRGIDIDAGCGQLRQSAALS
ncbi:MAG TPA: 23S rRNA (adenine(2503)-C(2))-methyltransferase RlmN [Anaerolineae bacterium]|nr:23S rRNA (adenine(2503)-C(2))-methyltransferase RlmN [Anaerolineae bacterium]